MQKSKKQIAVETIDKPKERGGADPARHAKSLEILRSVLIKKFYTPG